MFELFSVSEHLCGMKKKAWEDKTGFADIESSVDLADQCHVKFDNAVEDVFALQEWDDAKKRMDHQVHMQ